MKTLQRQRIDLYKRRTFSETLSAVFDFVGENFRPLFRTLTVFLLPICLVVGMCYSVLINQIGDAEASMARKTSGAIYGIVGNYVLLFLLSLLSGAVLSGVVYTLMQQYYARKERLMGITYTDIKPTVWKNIRRMLVITIVVGVVCTLLALLCIGLCAVLISVMAGSWLLNLLCFGLCLVLCVALVAGVLAAFMAVPASCFGGLTVRGSLKQAVRYGFRTNWRLFTILFILYIICSLVSMALGIPYYILVALKIIADVDTSSMQFTSAAWYTFVSYLASVVLMFGAYMSLALMYIGLAFCYGYAAEKIDGVSMKQSIDDFEALSDNQPVAEVTDKGTAESEIDNFEKL